MTRKNALQALLENSRALIAPEYAEEIAMAFGETLETLRVRIAKTKNFNRAWPYGKKEAEMESVSVYGLASLLVEKIAKQPAPEGIFHGAGRNAEYITEKSVAILQSI